MPAPVLPFQMSYVTTIPADRTLMVERDISRTRSPQPPDEHRPGPLTSSHAISRSYAARRLKRLLIKKHGRQADRWTEEWMHGLGLQKLLGTIRYPKAA
jgi:hypothetical protein